MNRLALRYSTRYLFSKLPQVAEKKASGITNVDKSPRVPKSLTSLLEKRVQEHNQYQYPLLITDLQRKITRNYHSTLQSKKTARHQSSSPITNQHLISTNSSHSAQQLASPMGLPLQPTPMPSSVESSV